MATHSNILAWRIPWTEETAGYSPWDRKEVDTTEQLSQFTLIPFTRGGTLYEESNWKQNPASCSMPYRGHKKITEMYT